jgi:hypothetical protein
LNSFTENSFFAAAIDFLSSSSFEVVIGVSTGVIKDWINWDGAGRLISSIFSTTIG